MIFSRKDFSKNSKGLNAPATVIALNSASTLVEFTKQTTPRSIRCDADGVLEVKDFNDTVVALNVIQGEIIPIMPKEITANTTIATQSLW